MGRYSIMGSCKPSGGSESQRGVADTGEDADPVGGVTSPGGSASTDGASNKPDGATRPGGGGGLLSK